MKLLLAFMLTSYSFLAFAQEPDLRELESVGQIIHSEVSGYETDRGWATVTELMKDLDVYDAQVARMLAVFCSAETNKSVLLVGDTDETFLYYFARLAKMIPVAGCKKQSHVTVNPSKLQGYMYSGTTQRLWRDKIVYAAFEKDVVLYFRNLSQLIGIGTHSNQDTGIEANYSEALLSGKLKSVAFVNKYDYNRLSRSKHAYVLNAFKEKITINETTLEQVDKLSRKFFELASVPVADKVYAYLYKMSDYYQPNVKEPKKTMRLVDAIVRKYNRAANGVTFKDVRDAIMSVVQIPSWMMNRNYRVVQNLPAMLDGDVVGVKEGKRDVIRQIKIGYVSGRTDEKPAGALMFVGPTGTGKSYIAKKAAEFMGMKLITMDMTQYSTPESFDRFLDSLSNSLTLNPYAFYLFEEIDKANYKVLDRLYFMLDEGIFYDRNQTPLFARGAFIMMTTNAGHDLIVREAANPDLRTLVNLELQKVYRPSFLNRFDAISIFTPFTDAEFLQLAGIMTSKKIKKMKEFFDWTVNVDQKVVDYMGKNGRSAIYGARPMERTVESVLSVGISEFQLQYGTLDFGSEISFTKARGKDSFKISVKGQNSITYKVELSNNSGKKRRSTYVDRPFVLGDHEINLNEFFEGIRMY